MDTTNTDTSWSSDIDQSALLRWMNDQAVGNGTITNPELLCGGTQNILQRFTTGSETVVLRRPPKVLRKESNKMILREAQVLSAIAKSTIPHPKLVSSCADESVIGTSFYLMKSVDGFNAINGVPDPLRSSPNKVQRMGFSALEAALELGSLNFKDLGLDGFGKPNGYHERQVQRWMSQLESYHSQDGWPGYRELPDVESISQWLEKNIPKAYKPGIIHGDFHLGNMLFDTETGDLNALVDWELSTIGDPLLDLGWLLVTLPEPQSKKRLPAGFPSKDELIAYYSDSSERDCTAVSWYAVLASFKLAIILEGTFARACAGKASKSTGDLLHRQSISLLEKAQQWL